MSPASAVWMGRVRRLVADDTGLKRALTARRWMSRVYFEARYLARDPWRLETSSYERERAAASLAALAGRRYARALDVGCGEGAFTGRLLERCERVVAVDFSALAACRARARFAAEPRVDVRRLDVCLEDPGGTFDLVFCAELFYYLNAAESEAVTARMMRWVAPGGDLCLVHGTSCHDISSAAAPGGPRAVGASAIHGRFRRLPDVAVLRDVSRPRHRITVLRRGVG